MEEDTRLPALGTLIIPMILHSNEHYQWQSYDITIIKSRLLIVSEPLWIFVE